MEDPRLTKLNAISLLVSVSLLSSAQPILAALVKVVTTVKPVSFAYLVLPLLLVAHPMEVKSLDNLTVTSALVSALTLAPPTLLAPALKETTACKVVSARLV